MKKLTIILLILPLLFWYCRTSEISISNKDVSSIYNPVSAMLHPEYVVFHNSDTASLLFFKIPTFELLFRAEDESGKNKAQISVFYKVHPSIDNKEIVDSATTVLNLNKSPKKHLVSYIPIKIDLGNNYIIEIFATDLLRNAYSQKILEINKTDISSKQFFLFSRKGENEPLFRSFTNDTIELKINNRFAENKNITIKKYKDEFSPSLPPFTGQTEKFELEEPDYNKTLTHNKNIHFTINDPGIYSFEVEGFDSIRTSFNFFRPHYPAFKTPEQLLEPLIYLNSSKEYNKLKEFENPKHAVDSFWINTTGNVERAKELIRIYYNRAQLSNYYFTSFKEGWKTDRGMIYMVLGIPTTIFKTNNSEIWTYGKSSTYRTMEFTFEKREHPLSENNYVLSRSEIYDRIWYQAVDTWRNGRAFSVMN